MATAIAVWRLYPTQIESGLSACHGRKISEWLREDFTMSSRELLSLLDELPETSKFKEASQRTYRLAEFPDGRLSLFSSHRVDRDGMWQPGELPAAAELLAEFVDWTHDRKIAARHAREMAIFRMEMRQPGMGYDVDMSGLTEPLQALLEARAALQQQENIRGAKGVIRNSLFATKGGET